MKKRGQQTMSLPFGMIFSIFLIVVFIVIAFIAVGYFLNIGKTSKVGRFYEDFQKAVDNAWSAQSTETSFEINLPSNIKKVCFADFSAKITNSIDYNELKYIDNYDANVFLIPPNEASDMEVKLISHLDISRITKTQNPYCVDTSGSLKIKKDFYDKLVCVGEYCTSDDKTVGEVSSTSEKTICERAENNNDCGLLGSELGKGSNYVKACCSEHGLCC